ncbi:NAD(P)H-dependent glycerol-3-phosphate dehydrogenase [Candidatus Dependentiae bacterium]|nr:MAG: NAD(P)H-dependent glycerol-3-phosphate dehydrogenase [Candidatus Dependentiae bacterium]
MKKALAIIGAGSWGTALAYFFGSKGYIVYLWCYEKEVADSIKNNQINLLFLSHIQLPRTVHASTDIQYILSCSVDFVIEAIPVTYLRPTLASVDTAKALSFCWILTSKGLEQETGYHALQVMEHLFGKEIKAIVLAGPSFALELIQGMPTSCVAATSQTDMYELFAAYWQDTHTKLYYTNDMNGVLFCGALKNIVALLLGLLEGAGYGKNTQSFFLTVAYKEIKQVVSIFGGQEATVEGLAGFGDLFLTASSNISKNRTYGYLIGQKKKVNEIHKQIPVPPEGVSTAAGFNILCRLFSDIAPGYFPLLCSVHNIIKGKSSIKKLVDSYFA